jgi:hypothetical protein
MKMEHQVSSGKLESILKGVQPFIGKRMRQNGGELRNRGTGQE